MKQISANPNLMKTLNKNMVRQTLKTLKKATKQQLSKQTGLSVVTIGAILNEMIEQKEAELYDLIPSNGGRPAATYQYCPQYRHAAILFTHAACGAENLFVRVVDLFGQSVYQEQSPLEDASIESFDTIILNLIKKYPSISAIGFGMPGVEANGTVITNDLQKLTGSKFSAYYEKKFALPVIFQNDVNAAVIGYHKIHHLKEENIVYLYFPKIFPPGAGIMIQGQLYQGYCNYAGEVNNIPLGIDWCHIDYQKTDQLIDVIGRLIVSITAVLSPQLIIVSNEFLTNNNKEALCSYCKKFLPKQVIPNITIAANFTQDFEEGIIQSTLELLNSHLSLVEK